MTYRQRWLAWRESAQPFAGASRRTRLEPGRARRPRRRLAPGRQCDRDRQARSLAAAGASARSPVRPRCRGDLPRRKRPRKLARLGRSNPLDLLLNNRLDWRNYEMKIYRMLLAAALAFTPAALLAQPAPPDPPARPA